MSLPSLETPGTYILTVSLRGVFSSTFPGRWESVSVQPCDCQTVVDVPQAVCLGRTWSRVRSVTSSWRRCPWSIIEFSSGVEVYDMWFVVERSRRALRMPLNPSTWSELQAP